MGRRRLKVAPRWEILSDETFAIVQVRDDNLLNQGHRSEKEKEGTFVGHDG
jgi:hypothetical protein